MKEITTNLTTHAVFSENGRKRYLLTKVWDTEKPRLTIVMLSPSEASGIELDNTTMLVLNNASRLGYGQVSIVNLFATLGFLQLRKEEDKDSENLTFIERASDDADVVIYAPGVGKASNHLFIKRQNQVLDVLKPYEAKLRCLSNMEGKARFQHPLSPAVRTWYLSEMKVAELYKIDEYAKVEEQPVKKSKTKRK